jgi:tetratricopeptide (TPR) repeat protein
MSPEQVAADPHLDRRSDVYTLGVLLFELLAGRLPYSVERLPVAEAVRVIREREPARLGALDRRLRGDVETIVARALEKDPARRYPSAGELAADIRRHLAHEPILARPPSALYQVGKFARRHKALMATTLAFLALLLGAGALTAWRAVRAERDEAVRQARRSQEVVGALARVAVLREQARTSGDLGKWAEARAEARRAEVLAEEGPVEPGLGEQIDVLRRELTDEEADRRLLARLEKARLLQVDVNVAETGFSHEKSFPEYREAFTEYGLRPDSTDPAEATALLRARSAEVRGPAVAALNGWLFRALPLHAPEAGWLERVLAAADPDDWRQRLRAARVAQDVRAVAGLAGESGALAQPTQVLADVGGFLQDNGSTEDAVALLRRAQEASPDDFWVNLNLGLALAASQPSQLGEAIRFLSVAVALRPRSPGARLDLAKILVRGGRLDEALVACRKAIGLKRDFADAHLILGNVLSRKGRLDEALAAYRESLAIRPRFAMAHYNLGTVLLEQGDSPAAAACFERALEINPDHAEAHCNLGSALLNQGDPRAALEEVRTGHNLGVRRKDWHNPSDQWIKRCEHFIELADRLPAVLKGEDQPATAAERAELADLCHYKRLHVSAARLYTEALDSDPKLANDLSNGHRYRAACSAAQADCGEGEGAAAVPDKARANLLKQALEWLRADLAGRTRQLERGTPQDRVEVQIALHVWRSDRGLAGVRDAGRLAALPSEERAAWQQLWADVAALAAKARDGK